MNRTAFVINPSSAKKQSEAFVQQLKKKVSPLNYHVSKSVEDTAQYIEQNRSLIDVFVAVGGDGTIASVAKNLVNTESILAVFPAGSGNGFSNETHFDTTLEALIEKLRVGKTRKIDTFKIGSHLSINVSGTGFDADIAQEFEKTSRGFANYIKVSAKAFFNSKPIKIQFHSAELEPYSGTYLMLNIANTRQFGNHAYIAPNASKSDGLVDIVLVKKFPLMYGLRFALRMFRKTLKTDRYLTYLPVSEAEFSVNTTSFQLDGEYVEIASPVRIEVLPKSLKILV